LIGEGRVLGVADLTLRVTRRSRLIVEHRGEIMLAEMMADMDAALVRAAVLQGSFIERGWRAA
jgi:hypothetical protein